MEQRQISELAREAVEQFDLPSLGIGVSQNGADFSAVLGAGNDQTLYPLASISKTFLATAICQLADSGKISLDVPIKEYWEDFALQDQYASEHLTLRDILCHRSGLPAHDLMRFTSRNQQQLDLEQVALSVRNLQPNCELRYKMQYSNLMYAVATYVLEKVTKQDYVTYFKEQLLNPYNLNNVYVNHHEATADRIARPFINDHGTQREIPLIAPGPVGGASSMLANIDDLLAWSKLQLQWYQDKDGIDAQRYEPHTIMKVKRQYANPVFTSYGLGMMLENYHGYHYFYHTGSFIGYRSLLGFVPELNLTFVLTTNLDGSNSLQAISYQLLDMAINKTDVDWLAKIQQMDAVYNKKENLAAKVAACTPVSPTDALCGNYRNDGYGLVTVRDDGERTILDLGPIPCTIVVNQQQQHFVKFPVVDQLIPMEIEADCLKIFSEPALNEPIIFNKQKQHHQN